MELRNMKMIQLSTYVLVFLLNVCASFDLPSTKNSDDAWSDENDYPKFRHARHPRPDNAYSEISVTNKIQDNHKPVFVNCSRYQPSVKEEQPIGTFVFQVTAVDDDLPEDGGTITYTFVSPPGVSQRAHKFAIDNSTGVITTKHMFDRDEPNREKEFYITVRATDNGKPPLDDVCTIEVTIDDVNDNQPNFDKVSYIESVPQDLPVNSSVMRISATDPDDGSNSRLSYDLAIDQLGRSSDLDYFRMDQTSGIIYLEKPIDKQPDYKFKLQVTASDHGQPHMSSQMKVQINVIESKRRSPSFEDIPPSPIIIAENFNNFSHNIAEFVADSNSDPGEDPVFELVAGASQATNKGNTFRLLSNHNRAFIRLAGTLDYETTPEYSLTVRIQNKYNLAAETSIVVQVLDVNDFIPRFIDVVSGSVPENEPPGTQVMQVRAIDLDGTAANNQVTYELVDNTELFEIDPISGNITTKTKFDREEKDVYLVKINAMDNSPSALPGINNHNIGQQVFRIEISDKNDNPPRFTQNLYFAEAVAENENENTVVMEVKALDNDTASPVMYDIVSGNNHNSFAIDPLNGKITVKNKLDYEMIKQYNLTVRAHDGAFEDTCTVMIRLENVNDNLPEFLPFQDKVSIQEETIEDVCIARIQAYDPDIEDRSAPQHIRYFISKPEQRDYVTVDDSGCVRLTRPLDRDPPKGFPNRQISLGAGDSDGGPGTLEKSAFLYIELKDINDNAPYLEMKQDVIWNENQDPGYIVNLIAKDIDDVGNGEPFTFSIASNAPDDIISKFRITGSQLHAIVTFDREEQKSYQIPISITDSGYPSQTGTSMLTVVIGDENDNEMKPGDSSIFAFNYKGLMPDTEIGRVYVDDPDDWDLPDKQFEFAERSDYFDVNRATGMITVFSGTPSRSYLLRFRVYEEGGKILRHSVEATVNVTIKEIPEEAVDKSGSIRFTDISDQEFITKDHSGRNKADILRSQLAVALNTSENNVDVFTVLHHPNNSTFLDVRFSAHGSPYYSPEKINQAINVRRDQFENEMNLKMFMVSVDDCAFEHSTSCLESSCFNFLKKGNYSSVVYTNKTSFVGITAFTQPTCICLAAPFTCLNGGILISKDNGLYSCDCPDGFEGPNCQSTAIGFKGDGWALYPALQSCDEMQISLYVRTDNDNGLVFYMGPEANRAFPFGEDDFIALEVVDGYPYLMVDYGSGTTIVNDSNVRLSDSELHRIDIRLAKTAVELSVGSCSGNCPLGIRSPVGSNKILNAHGPLQVGGTYFDVGRLASYRNWTYKPRGFPFRGCISNLTVNGVMLNLGMPSVASNIDSGCTVVIVAVPFIWNWNFLLLLLLFLIILTVLLLALMSHRRKTDELIKDADDVRANIVKYADEGGGEEDMTGYDMSVFGLRYEGVTPHDNWPSHKLRNGLAPGEVPDICGFLDDKKQIVDKDPESTPFDDVRHYAYEGDGNSSGSLSSLASGTDEGDLNFDYLSNFGPRFRKLADMYGEETSDEESDTYHTNSESWC